MEAGHRTTWAHTTGLPSGTHDVTISYKLTVQCTAESQLLSRNATLAFWLHPSSPCPSSSSSVVPVVRRANANMAAPSSSVAAAAREKLRLAVAGAADRVSGLVAALVNELKSEGGGAAAPHEAPPDAPEQGAGEPHPLEMPELLNLILLHVDEETLLRSAVLVSKAWCRAVHSPPLWAGRVSPKVVEQLPALGDLGAPVSLPRAFLALHGRNLLRNPAFRRDSNMTVQLGRSVLSKWQRNAWVSGGGCRPVRECITVQITTPSAVPSCPPRPPTFTHPCLHAHTHSSCCCAPQVINNLSGTEGAAWELPPAGISTYEGKRVDCPPPPLAYPTGPGLARAMQQQLHSLLGTRPSAPSTTAASSSPDSAHQTPPMTGCLSTAAQW